MSNYVMFITFNLVEGASVSDFLLSSKRLHEEFLSNQKGFISWQQLVDGDDWVDLLTWESAEDAKISDETSCTNPASLEYYKFIRMESCKVQFYSVERSY